MSGWCFVTAGFAGGCHQDRPLSGPGPPGSMVLELVNLASQAKRVVPSLAEKCGSFTATKPPMPGRVDGHGSAEVAR
ncbi:hypothetical protein [Actinoallomurus vinaceus]|uniref:hypothetical protein n=1 Tax=Actinoallomurus vinaceus TaxID=1080074 RepID=UPI0031E54F45